jgi:SulP family sulfate permease
LNPAAGTGPLAGLYGAIFCGFFATVFGGTPAQISGPAGPMTVLMALVIAHFTDNLAAAYTVVVMAGLLQLVFGFAGVGRYIKLVPYPVVSGFMSGIGCIIIILQIPPLLGYSAPDGVSLVKLAAMPEMFVVPETVPLQLGALSFAVMVLMPARFASILPSPLIALMVGTAVGMVVLPGAPVIGEIPSGLPEPHLPAFPLAEVPYMIRTALALAFLGSIDSLLTSLVADSITRTSHDSNRELIGQGIGNTIAGIFGAIPGAGATMRTVVNVRAGGRTPVSGALHALVLLALVLGFGKLAAHIPLAVLAGILLKVGIDIIDWRYLKRIRRAPRAGVIIMLVTLSATVLVDLVTAVAVGVVMACVLFVTRMSDAQMKSAKLIYDPEHVDDWTPEEARITLFHMEGPLSFGSAKDVAHMLRSSVEHDVLIIDLCDVPFIDSSASIALEEVISEMHADGDAVILCSLRESVRKTLDKIGLLAILDPRDVVDDRLSALISAEARLRD